MTYTGKVTSAESLGRILQQTRLLAGLSKCEFVHRLGTTQKHVGEFEAGKLSILMDRLFAAMRETGMELSARITPADDRGRSGRLTCANCARSRLLRQRGWRRTREVAQNERRPVPHRLIVRESTGGGSGRV